MPSRNADLSAAENASILHIGLFFDGTRNNVHNLARGVQDPDRAPVPHPAMVAAQGLEASPYRSRITSSYDGAPTTIARLHALYPDGPWTGAPAPSIAVYTEGTGTRDGRADDLIGLAFGTGATGVTAKADQALQVQLPAALSALAQRWTRPLRAVEVDLFGYSRGAASAREAANRLSAWSSAHWQDMLRTAGLALSPAFTVPIPVIRFIGLFDTVLAIRGGVGQDRPRMRLDPDIARKVVHLVARDEHRLHFPLTSVAPQHEEYALPGSHADIGGGQEVMQEGPKLLTRPRGEPIRRHAFDAFATPDLHWLRRTASHQRAETSAVEWRRRLQLGSDMLWVDTWHQWVRQRHAGSSSALPSPVLFVYSAVVLKRPLRGGYTRVALQLMHARAAAAGVQWRHTPAEVAGGAVPDDLQDIAAALQLGQPLDAAQEVRLRQHYLLQSAHWNFDALGDTALTYAADASSSALPYRPGPDLLYINRPTEDGHRIVLPNA